MSDEIRVNVDMTLDNGAVEALVSARNEVFDQTTARFVKNVQEIGVGAENLDLGEVATPKWAFFRNVGDTNNVEIGVDNAGFVELFELAPGEFAMGPLSVAQPQANAVGGATDLLYLILDT